MKVKDAVCSAAIVTAIVLASGTPACMNLMEDLGKDDCQSDADCPPGLACIGTFLGSYCGCDDDGDCAGDKHCFAGTCMDGCHSEVECPASETCWQGKCWPGCQDDSGCEPGFRCTTEGPLGHCLPSCTDDSGCSSGACLCGVCAAECSPSGQCLKGESCELAKCGSRVCVQ